MRLPKYRKNSDGRAFVEYRRKRYYLGKYGSEESRTRYLAFLAQIDAEKPLPDRYRAVTVVELCSLFLTHAQATFGATSSRVSAIEYMIKHVRDFAGHTAIDDFGPRRLVAFQGYLVGQKYTRKWINNLIHCLKAMFRWGAMMEYISPTAFHSVAVVPGLKSGQTAAPDKPPIRPVEWKHVEAVFPFVNRRISAMIQIQYFCGMRPGEVCKMRWCDIDKSGDIWLYRPAQHKTARLGKQLVKAIPKVAQTLLLQFEKENSQECIFSPLDALSERRHGKRQKHKRPPPKRKRRKFYTTSTYWMAIEYGRRAAKRKGIEIPNWHPNQIRHAIATRIRQEISHQAAQVFLGHSRMDTTSIYAERQTKELIAVAKLVDKWGGAGATDD